MPIPFFIAFVWFCLWLGLRLKSNRKRNDTNEQSFWDREREANFTRAKPLTDLTYIRVPVDTLPFHRLQPPYAVPDVEDTILALSKETIVNLTGVSNTDLKLRYGAANITALSAYDANFTALVTALQKWGQAFMEAAEASGHPDDLYADARAVFEYAVSIGSDISATYKSLAGLYLSHSGLSAGEAREKCALLLEQAASLNSLTSPQLIAYLETIVHQEA